MQVLVTGATGFVGGRLLERLASGPHSARAAVRRDLKDLLPGVPTVAVGDISMATDWGAALAGVEVVIHAASRAHVLDDRSIDPLAEFRKVNVAGTLALANQAVRSGVKRFIFISSIGVNGNETFGEAFSDSDQPNPVGPYAISKLEAEEGLMELASRTGMEVVVIRPPLVYGPNAPGNYGRLFRLVRRGIPLPLGSIHNQRSLVALDNLVDLLVTCIRHPNAANQTFLVSDGEDLSTTQLLQRMAHALGRPARLLPVPAWVLEAGAAMLGKRALSQRLCGSLQVDISKTRTLLGWDPPVSVDEALSRTARNFLAEPKSAG